MKKISLLLIILFLVTGCSVSSNITISRDLTVKEEVKMTGTPEFFSRYAKSLPLTTINSLLEVRKHILIENNYDYYIDKKGTYPVVVANKEYNNISSFVNNTIFSNQYFENFETTTNNNLVSIKATDFIPYDPDYIERYEISNCNINIRLPFVVTKHNADSYDEKTNTYTWKITKKTENKEINLTFDKTKIYIYNLVMYISIVILILIIIILILVTRSIFKKNKKNNKIYG